ncbi:MAG: phage head closure protein [Candidatus Latescibacteria bacterium]|nr:phage head closure protein [Candidatus Latescibacterota bacterium]NIO78055.1 phage head closure protein [Candidatus Latescibacterota bacterium]
MPQRSGLFDREITIEVNTPTRDAIGGTVDSWATFQSVWAQVIPVKGEEILKFSREVSGEVNRFTFHYVAGVLNEHRIVYEGENWNILFIREIRRREALEVTAERERP